MKIRFTQAIKRSLLFAFAVAVTVVAPPIQANSQTIQQTRSTVSTQLAQVQTLRNAVVAVETIGMTVSDLDRAVEFYSEVLFFKQASDVEVLGTENEQL